MKGMLKKATHKKVKSKQLKATAYHEAGHVVVGCLLGLKLRFVTIEPDKFDLTLEEIQQLELTGQPVDLKQLRGTVKWEDSSDRIALLLTNLSGDWAARRIDRDYGSTLGDANNPIMDLSDLNFDIYQECSLFEVSYDIIDEILDSNWSLVKLVAERLLEKKTLYCQEVENLMDENPAYRKQLHESVCRRCLEAVTPIIEE